MLAIVGDAVDLAFGRRVGEIETVGTEVVVVAAAADYYMLIDPRDETERVENAEFALVSSECGMSGVNKGFVEGIDFVVEDVNQNKMLTAWLLKEKRRVKRRSYLEDCMNSQEGNLDPERGSLEFGLAWVVGRLQSRSLRDLGCLGGMMTRSCRVLHSLLSSE